MSADGPVLIAGAGPAGLCLAVLLAQRGVAVRVLEPAVVPDVHSRAIGLHPPALDVLDLAGVGGRAVAEGVRIRDGVALSSGREVARIDFGAVSGRHPYVLALPQARTVALLAERLEEVSPGSLVRGRRVTGFSVAGSAGAAGPRDGSGAVAAVRVRTDGGADSEAIEGARRLVGADGVRSAVRGAAGLAFRGRAHPDRYAMGDFPDGTGFGSTAVLFLHAAGIVESFPLPGGTRRWVVRLRGSEDPASSADTARWIAKEVLARTGHSIDPAGCTMTSVFGTRRRSVASMVAGAGLETAGSVVLVGDAAHEISPIGGQGITLGLQDAAAVAELICGGTAGPEEWAAFSRNRLSAARIAGRQAHLNMALGRPLPASVLAIRNGAMRLALSVPGVRDGVARRFTMDF